jgi:hypothetical protein
MANDQIAKQNGELAKKFLACALCDPARPRPASIICTNRCGRYVCAAHARPLHPDGSGPMVCLACWEQLQRHDKKEVVQSLIDSLSGERRNQTQGVPTARNYRFFVITLACVLMLMVTLGAFFIVLWTGP